MLYRNAVLPKFLTWINQGGNGLPRLKFPSTSSVYCHEAVASLFLKDIDQKTIWQSPTSKHNNLIITIKNYVVCQSQFFFSFAMNTRWIRPFAPLKARLPDSHYLIIQSHDRVCVPVGIRLYRTNEGGNLEFPL